jgi:DNA invertase Pin-like site-specific DNA recombinase
MAVFGYARVSTLEQNLERQLEALNLAGCEKIFMDKMSGANIERPQLQMLLETITAGDTIIIKDLTRFSRSTRDLFDLLDLIKAKGAFLRSIQDKWLDTSDTNPFNDLLFHIMSALSEYERKLIKIRQREGIEIAKKKGMYKGRPKQYTMKNERLAHAMDLYFNHQDTLTVKKVCAMTGIKEATFYRNWKVFKENKLGENGK